MVVTQERLEDLLASGHPVGHADLSDIDWSDVSGGVLVARHCTFNNVQFSDAELAGARFEDCTFSRCRFAGTNLTDAAFLRCGFFDGETREGCSFSRADLQGATFENCNLATADFGLANLFDATFKNCKAAGASFEGSRFNRMMGRRAGPSRVSFSHCMLDMADFSQAQLADCILAECSLRQANLRQAVLSSADLHGSDLSEAMTVGAIFDHADLRDAVLFGLDVTRLAGFEGIRVSADQLPDIVRAIGIKVFPASR